MQLLPYSGIIMLFAWILLSLFVSLVLCTQPNDTPKTFCVGEQYLKGKWLKTNVAKKSFYCCGWDNFDYTHNIKICENNSEYAQWTLLRYQGSNEHVSHVGGQGCSCDAKSGHRGTVSPREEYIWTPDECELNPWDAKRFCKLLGNRTVLLIGDSTMQQAATTLTNMILTGNGGCNHRFQFVKNYQLTYGEDKPYTELFHAKLSDPSMYQELRDYKPDICVMTAGAHFYDEGDLYTMLEHMKTWLPPLREGFVQEGRDLKFIWKSQQPGHVGCETRDKPYDSMEEIDMSTIHDKYSWTKHVAYDGLTKGWAPILNYTYMDMSPLYLRIDAHPASNGGDTEKQDCLHYCLPGPLDLFAILFLHILIEGF